MSAVVIASGAFDGFRPAASGAALVSEAAAPGATLPEPEALEAVQPPRQSRSPIAVLARGVISNRFMGNLSQ
jgi:hypothetical protein